VRRQLLVLVLRLHQLLLRLALLLQQLLLRLVTLQMPMPRLRLLPGMGMGREMATKIWMLQLQMGEFSMAHVCLINLATQHIHDFVNV
jgi:hypothetical protein